MPHATTNTTNSYQHIIPTAGPYRNIIQQYQYKIISAREIAYIATAVL